MLPLFVLYQYAADARPPAGKIADLAFTEMPITFVSSPPPDRSSSPTVGHNKRLGLWPLSPASPSEVTVLSVTELTFKPVSRSNQSLPTIPFCLGHEPVIIAACPGA